MVHTKIYKNITLGQILMTLMVISIMISLFTLTVFLFGRDNPTKINQQINASGQMNKVLNAATLKSQEDTEKRLEKFITENNKDNHMIIAKIDKATSQVAQLLGNLNSTVTKTENNVTAHNEILHTSNGTLQNTQQIKSMLQQNKTRLR